MADDVVKAADQAEKIVEILGLKITRPDRFFAIVVALLLVGASVALGYWWVEQARAGLETKLTATSSNIEKLIEANKVLVAANEALGERLTAETKALDEKLGKATTSFDAGIAAANAAAEELEIERSASASDVDEQIDALWERIAEGDAYVQTLNRSLAALRKDVNLQGNWLPIPIRFGDATTKMRFTLQIPQNYVVSALFVVEEAYKDELEGNVVIAVNGTPLESPNRYVTAMTPQTVDGDWIEGDFQNFEVYLKTDNADAAFESIKNGNIALLVVIKRDDKEEVPRTQENVPS